MAGTYWLTILPETSKLREGIRRAVREAESGLNVSVGFEGSPESAGREFGDKFTRSADAKVTPEVDNSGVDGDGREGGRKYRRGFDETSGAKPTVDTSGAYPSGRQYGKLFGDGFSSTAKLAAAIGGIGVGLKLATSGPAVALLQNMGKIAVAAKVASVAALTMGFFLTRSGSALRVFAGLSLIPLAKGLGFVSEKAGFVGKQVSRVATAAALLAGTVSVLGFLSRAGRLMAYATVGGAALFGVFSALSYSMFSSLTPALQATAASLGVVAGAAIGLLGPALFVAKTGFAGMAEGAKEFNAQFADADKVFNTMIGERMGPMLTAFRELKQSITDTFSNTLVPSFANLGTFMDTMKPRAGALATVLGEVGNGLTRTLNGPAMQQAFDQMFAAASKFFGFFRGDSGLSGLITGISQFAATAATTFADFGGSIDNAFGRLGKWLGSISPFQMKAVFQVVKQSVESVMDVLGPIFSAIRDLGAVAAPALAPGFKSIGDAIRDATPGFIQMAKDLMPALSQVMTNLAPILPILVSTFTPWSQILAVVAPALATIVTQLAPFAPLIFGAVLAFKALTAGIFLYNAVSLAFNVVTKAVTAGMWLFNAALAANPIGLIIAAVVLIGVALWAFFTKTEIGRKIWEKFSEFMRSAWEKIKSTFEKFWPVIKSVFKALIDKAGEVWTSIQTKFTAVVDFVKNLPGKISSAAKGMWDGISGAFKTMVNTLIRVWNGFSDKLEFTVPDIVGVPNRGEKFRPIPRIAEFADGGQIRGSGSGTSDSILARVSNGEFIVNAASTSRYLELLQTINAGRLPGFAEGGLVSTTQLQNFAKGVEGKKYVWGGIRWGDCSGAVSALANYATGRAPFASRFGTATMGTELAARGFRSGAGGAGSLTVGWFNGGPYGGHTAATLPDGTNFEMGGKRGNGQYGGPAAGAGDSMFTNRMHLPAEFFTGLDAGAPTIGSASSSGGVSGLGSISTSSGGGISAGSASSGGSSASSGGSFVGADGVEMEYRPATSSELESSRNKVDSTAKSVREGEQRLEDLKASIEKDKAKLAQLEATPTYNGQRSPELQAKIQAANDAIAKSERELTDATNDLATKRAAAGDAVSSEEELRTRGKLEKAKKDKDSKSGSDASSLGSTFVSGILESIGLDGSLFTNPLEWPTVRSIMAGVNFGGKLLSGGDGTESSGGFAAGAADAVGLGGLLSAIPGVVQPGLDPGSINPAVPGTSLAAAGTNSVHGAAAGGAPGPVDNSINFNGPVGMSPAAVQNKVTSMQTARTRTTKVN